MQEVTYQVAIRSAIIHSRMYLNTHLTLYSSQKPKPSRPQDHYQKPNIEYKRTRKESEVFQHALFLVLPRSKDITLATLYQE